VKVLLVTNIVAPPGVSVADPSAATFGGWVANILAALAGTAGLTLAVAVRSPAPRLVLEEMDGVLHCRVPRRGRAGLAMDPAALTEVVARASPDLMHVEGAEMPHAHQALEAFDGPAIVSMQGVMHGLAPYEYGGLPLPRWAAGLHRPRRALMAAALLAARRTRFDPRVAGEAKVMARARHVIGRTGWDRAHARLLSPRAAYHHVPRILRPAFRARAGSAREVRRHAIFIGNANHPRKGAHVALAALCLLRREFPDVSLVIAGEPPATGWRDVKKAVGYPAFLARQARTLGLAQRVRHTGVLGAEAMAAEMARAHVFLLSSLIENSPNTLAEAMALGVPCVCAYAGGAPDMAQPDREALFYRAEDPVTLAHQIARVFASDALAASLGAAAAERARRVHDPDTNRERLLAAWRAALGERGSGAQPPADPPRHAA